MEISNQCIAEQKVHAFTITSKLPTTTAPVSMTPLPENDTLSVISPSITLDTKEDTSFIDSMLALSYLLLWPELVQETP